jgi:hypothetical protein
MLLLQTVLTAAYLAFVVRVWGVTRRRGTGADVAVAGPLLPAADCPPESAVGWPPLGTEFGSYVDEGITALDAYLSGGLAP